MRVLAGDIGGTKTAIAIVEIGPRSLRVGRSRQYPSGRFGSLEEILLDFLAGVRARPAVAAFGVAGPVRKGTAKVTKLPWTIEEGRLERATGIARILVINDFFAGALGLSYLKPRQFAVLSAGSPERGGPIALIGAGTGLGQSALVEIQGRYEAVASEGGHADFGPRNERENRLVRFVRAQFGRVDRDRLLCGQGLGLMYDFLKSDGFARERPAVVKSFRSADRAAVISRLALAGRDRLCREALCLFVSIYGSEAGNLALQYRATGGLFVAGGIAPKILPALTEGGFLEAFRSKPPLEDFLSRVPVRIVKEPLLGLYGAAAAAYRLARQTGQTR